MLVIRLSRTGRKNQPSFRIVVTEKTKSSTGGRSVEQVGFYNPTTKERILKKERILYWISKGAQPSDTIHNMLITEKVIEGRKVPKHRVVKAVEAPKEQAEPAKTEEKTEETTPQA